MKLEPPPPIEIRESALASVRTNPVLETPGFLNKTVTPADIAKAFEFRTLGLAPIRHVASYLEADPTDFPPETVFVVSVGGSNVQAGRSRVSVEGVETQTLYKKNLREGLGEDDVKRCETADAYFEYILPSAFIKELKVATEKGPVPMALTLGNPMDMTSEDDGSVQHLAEKAICPSLGKFGPNDTEVDANLPTLKTAFLEFLGRQGVNTANVVVVSNDTIATEVAYSLQAKKYPGYTLFAAILGSGTNGGGKDLNAEFGRFLGFNPSDDIPDATREVCNARNPKPFTLELETLIAGKILGDIFKAMVVERDPDLGEKIAHLDNKEATIWMFEMWDSGDRSTQIKTEETSDNLSEEQAQLLYDVADALIQRSARYFAIMLAGVEQYADRGPAIFALEGSLVKEHPRFVQAINDYYFICTDSVDPERKIAVTEELPVSGAYAHEVDASYTGTCIAAWKYARRNRMAA